MRRGSIILTGARDPIEAIEHELAARFELLRTRYRAGFLPAGEYAEALRGLCWEMDALIDYVNNAPRRVN